MINSVKLLTNLSPNAEQALRAVIKQKVVLKGAPLVEEGVSCQALYVVQKGIMQHYINLDGHELTGCFSAEGDWVTVTGFFSQLPSRETIVALEDTTLLFVTRSDLLGLYDRHPDIERFGRLLAERAVMQLEELYFLVFTPGSASERYERFAAKYNHILQRVPLHMIASLLRMNQATLSRVRAKTSNCQIN